MRAVTWNRERAGRVWRRQRSKARARRAESPPRAPDPRRRRGRRAGGGARRKEGRKRRWARRRRRALRRWVRGRLSLKPPGCWRRRARAVWRETREKGEASREERGRGVW
jgi:hypothetical protein